MQVELFGAQSRLPYEPKRPYQKIQYTFGEWDFFIVTSYQRNLMYICISHRKNI